MLKKIKMLLVCVATSVVLSSCALVNASGKTELPQLAPVSEGEEIAVMTTDLGVIKIRFFPEYAPKSVENFITHSKNGYYDGLIFHRVINEFVIQSGDPLGTGTGGESIWGEGFETELSPQLHHIRGALGQAKSSDPNSNGSQFYIVQNTELSDEAVEWLNTLEKSNDQKITVNAEIGEKKVKELFQPDIIKKYKEDGGTPQLDFGYTVFGQVIEGMDVVDRIASAKTTNEKPDEDIHIQTITFESYKK